jgi:hypothetical protein
MLFGSAVKVVHCDMSLNGWNHIFTTTSLYQDVVITWFTL